VRQRYMRLSDEVKNFAGHPWGLPVHTSASSCFSGQQVRCVAQRIEEMPEGEKRPFNP
jgi:hypothetical protein